MTAIPLVVDDVVHRIEGALVQVRLGERRAELTLGAVGAVVVNEAIASVTSLVAAGSTLEEAAVAASQASGEVTRRTERFWLPGGGLLLDDTAATTLDDVRASLRVLADIGRSGHRTVAVIGALQVEERDRLEAHDSLGRIVVRLDIAQLVVIGHGARHLAMAASLEGSWNGESVLFDDGQSAYDFVRATTGPNTVILVSGGAESSELVDLVARLREPGA